MDEDHDGNQKVKDGTGAVRTSGSKERTKNANKDQKEAVDAKTIVLSTHETAKLLRIGERGVQKRIKQGKIPAHKAPGLGGMGYQIILSDLPADEQARYWASLTNTAGDSDDDLKEWLERRKIFLSAKELADPAVQNSLACHRAYHNAPEGSKGQILRMLGETYDRTPLTIWRWIKGIDAHSKTSPLIEIGHQQIEIPKSRAFDDDVLACGITYRANNMHVSDRTAYDVAQTYARENGKKVGDYTTFLRMLKKIPEYVWTYLLKGPVGFDAECIPKMIRKWTEVPVQSIVCGDQLIIDWACQGPDSQVEILNAHLWMDCSSRNITGAAVSIGHYNSWTVGTALRMTLSYGIMDAIFTDWGKPEGSKHISHILKCLSHKRVVTGNFDQMEDACAHVTDDVQHVKAKGKPWLRPIENINRIVLGLLEREHIPGYRKRAEDSWENKEIQARLKEQIRRGELMRTEELVEKFFSVIQKHNQGEKHLREGGSIVPEQFFRKGLMSQHRTGFDEITLDYICRPVYVVKPRENGIIEVVINGQRRTYSSRLQNYKDKIELSIEPSDEDASAIVSSLDGEYLDNAACWKPQSFDDNPERERKRARQKEMMQSARSAAKKIQEGFGIIDTQVLAITTRSETAKKAAEVDKEIRAAAEKAKHDAKEQTKQMVAKGNELIAQASSQPSAARIGIAADLPTGSKELYRFWLDVHANITNGKTVSDELSRWYSSYPDRPEWIAEATMHEKFREEYIDRPYPDGLVEEFTHRIWVSGRVIDISERKKDRQV